MKIPKLATFRQWQDHLLYTPGSVIPCTYCEGNDPDCVHCDGVGKLYLDHYNPESMRSLLTAELYCNALMHDAKAVAAWLAITPTKVLFASGIVTYSDIDTKVLKIKFDNTEDENAFTAATDEAEG